MTAAGDSTHSTSLICICRAECPWKYIDSVFHILGYSCIAVMCKYQNWKIRNRVLEIENRIEVVKSKPTQPYQWYSPGIASVHPHLIHVSYSQTTSPSVRPFLAQLTAQCPYTLQWDALPLKIAPSNKSVPIQSTQCQFLELGIANAIFKENFY